MWFSFPVLLAGFLAGNLIHAVASALLNATGLQAYNDHHKENPDIINGFSGDAEPIHIAKQIPLVHGQLTWSQAVASGENNIAKLENPINREGYTSFKTHYRESDGSEGRPRGKYRTKNVRINQAYTPKELQDLLGVKASDIYPSISSFSQKLPINDDTKGIDYGKAAPVGQNGYMVSHGIIFANSNFKLHDLNEYANQLPPAEIMLQVWDDVAGSKKGDLQWAFRSHIVNEGTQNIMTEALQKLGSKERELVHVTQDCNKEVFQALSGTPNCKGMYPTLAYREGTRNKMVTDLYVWKEGTRNKMVTDLYVWKEGTRNKMVTDLYVWKEGTQNNFIAMKIGNK